MRPTETYISGEIKVGHAKELAAQSRQEKTFTSLEPYHNEGETPTAATSFGECCAPLPSPCCCCCYRAPHNVVVSDIAPVHCSLETVFEEEEFSEARLLRTAPYSAPINPIEECWSVLKASMKRELSGKMTEMLSNNHEGVTQTEYRLSFLEQIIDNNIATITPMLCLSTCNHVQKHFSKIMNLQDLKMDDNF